MRSYARPLLCLMAAACLVGCVEAASGDASQPADAVDLDREKALILGVLNAETRAALSRDYEAWRQHWVHEPYVVKTYMNMADSSFSETLGWSDVDDFVRTYIEAHPTPEPPPTPLADADVRVYGSGAWVSYEQEDVDQGRKRETRLMEKVEGAWRIAGMHTTIYGPAASN